MFWTFDVLVKKQPNFRYFVLCNATMKNLETNIKNVGIFLNFRPTITF